MNPDPARLRYQDGSVSSGDNEGAGERAEAVVGADQQPVPAEQQIMAREPAQDQNRLADIAANAS